MRLIELTDEQKEQILEEFEVNPDLKQITQKVFGNDSLDGRSKEGRAVRAFLAKSNMQYTTSLVERVEEIELTREQKEFLMSDNVEVGMNALEAA